MSKGRILIVEDDRDIGEMLQQYFSFQDYTVLYAMRGQDGLEQCRNQLPNLVVLDIMLPDMDGYEVCKRLRSSLRTSHIPIIFLTQKDERSDKIAGLELGADDYITKPFDMQELGLRVQNALRRASYENLTNPTTGLPGGKLIEEQLRNLMRRSGWAVLYIGIRGLDAFNEAYGFVAGADVLRFVAMILNEAVEEKGSMESFVGHIEGDDFIIITEQEHAQEIAAFIQNRFDEEIGAFYSFRDREAGHITIENAKGEEQHKDLMSLAVGVITEEQGPFSDIRQITEAAAQSRRTKAG
jgi:PleD family two-component response regulator